MSDRPADSPVPGRAGRVLLIANPAARRVRRAGAEGLARALEAAGLAVELRTSPRPDEAARASAGFDRVVVAGGDGTLRSVLCATDLAVALLPLGTSNSVARSLGIPLDIRRAAELAARGTARPVDMGEVSGPRVRACFPRPKAGEEAASSAPAGESLPFILCASAGVDAEVARRYEATRGAYSSFARWAHLAASVSLHHRHVPIDVTVEVEINDADGSDGVDGVDGTDGIEGTVGAPAERRLRGAKMVVAANMKLYGGLFMLAPAARADDGALDLLAIRGEGTAGLASALVRGFLRRRQRPPRAVTLRARRMRWEAPGGEDVPVQIDGEPAGYLPAEITVRPAAARMVLPPAPVR